MKLHFAIQPGSSTKVLTRENSVGTKHANQSEKSVAWKKHNYDDADRHLGFTDRGAAVVDSFFWNRVCQGPVRRNSHVELTVTESRG